MGFLFDRLSSDRGDSNTISHLLWIVLVVTLVLMIGTMIYNAVKEKGEDTTKKIKQSNSVFSGG